MKEKAIDSPGQVFVSDITYLETDESEHYLSLVTDACSREIMGYHLNHDMKAKSVAQVLQVATKNR